TFMKISACFWKKITQFGQDSICRGLYRAFEGKAAGTLMPSTAEFGRNGGHVHRALAANADANALLRHLAEEQRYLNAGDPKRIVHQASTIFIERTAALHVLARY